MIGTSKFIGLARVSSREQEREGFSLDVQEEALERYASRQGGEIVKLFRIAETASKQAERKTFRELLAYARTHAKHLTGVLFYKVDRAARNLFDYVELERLEADTGLDVVYVAQPTENSPAGRMQRRILANMAAFYTEQQSIDVKEGLARRVQEGLFAGKAPFGYCNVRINGRSIIEIDPVNAPKIRRIFELYASKSKTLAGVQQALTEEGINHSDHRAEFGRSTLYHFLRDRSYIGEVLFRGAWHAGTHEPIVDLATFQRVQVLLGGKTYNAHNSVYGSQMMTCSHCGRPVVVEVKTKKTKAGPKVYRYYRCSRYSAKDHPRHRVAEGKLDHQVQELFAAMQVADPKVSQWIVDVLKAKTSSVASVRHEHKADLQRQRLLSDDKLDRLLELHLAGDIDGELFRTKQTDLLARRDMLALQVEAIERDNDESRDIALNTFELSQALQEKWLTADIAEKRQLLEIVCLNLTLDGVSLVTEMRKPFDILVKGLSVPSRRGDWI